VATLREVKVAATLVIAVACLLFGAPAQAQNRDDDERTDTQENRSKEHFALAVGVGLADVDSVAETYLTAALRIRAGSRDNRQDDSHDWRGRPPETGGMKGYFEPEIGYWKASGKNGSGSDLLLGVNLVGVVPVGAVDTYIGAGVGAHRLDASLLSNPTSDSKQTKIGVNAQFGLDVYMTRSLSLFGTGRFDIVQDARKSIQAKGFLGLRCRF
jgi:opacity protein-like surface antigen